VFAIIGGTIVYLILLFDKKQRQKLNTILSKTKDVQPLFMKRTVDQKFITIKKICENDTTPSLTSQQLDELLAEYNAGKITLPDYCNRLSGLLAMVA
jgi:Sec7-like guanine-nucleotide exchange factor